MNSKLTYWPVNWKNGMSFSENHLNSQYLAMADSLRDVAGLQLVQYNYGLLGGDPNRRFSESFKDNITNEKVLISFCRAVTQNGSRIEILDENWDELTKPLSELIGSNDLQKSNFWYVLLIADVLSRVPVGQVNEQESPRRKPNTGPKYALELISQEDLFLDDLMNAIPIAKFEYTSSGLKKILDYIPPCTRVDSHEKLFEKFQQFDQYLAQIKEHAEKIIEKIDFKRKNNRDQNRLADDIDSLCKSYLNYFVWHYDEYRLILKGSPPIKLLQFFARMARVLNQSIKMGYDKTHMLKYFNQYATNLSVTELSQIISDTFENKYIHVDVTDTLRCVERFLATFEQIFNELKKLDYRELAPRQVVRDDRIIDRESPIPGNKTSGSGIRFRRPGASENLGDDLKD